MAQQSDDPTNLRPGTPVMALDGELLGVVREAHANYLLVDQEGHEDLEVPMDAVGGVESGRVHLTVNRSALTEVDHIETVHHQHGDEEP